jgi:amidophosphoribosyltransferase
VFGVYAPGHDVSRLAYFSLYALQHRGQESAGIATCEGGQITTLRDSGLVSQVFDEEKLRALEGDMAIGHVRYSTTGGGSWENAQPVWRDDGRELALAHNGNLTNAVELWAELKERGIAFRGTSDSEIIAALLSSNEGKLIEDAVTDVMPRLEGAYSTVVMTKRAIVAFRDPHGVRPLSLGRLDDRFVVASESCAFDIIGAELMREVHPGEMVSLTERGLETRQVVKVEKPATCVFEHIYFSRPDSRLEGKVLQQVRGRMGEILWREAPVEADLVISVPDSGNPAAAGFARASGLPRDDGLIKNRYVARTFIQPGQELRKHGLRLKFNPLPEIVGNRRAAGAKEVHRRISAPPIRHPCHYGVDMSTREEMIAHKRTVQEIADELDCDSLAYLSLDGVYEAIGTAPEDHCDACFSGRYPLGAPEEANGKFALEDVAVVPVPQ